MQAESTSHSGEGWEMADTDDLGGVVDTEWVEIPGADVTIIAFVAKPHGASNRQTLVIIPENVGITDWRQQETQRMVAELDWPVIVMSPYSRIGARPPAGPFETPDDRRRAAFLAMPDEQVAADLEATIAWVGEQDFSNGQRPAVLGFCSGGGQGIYAVATRPKLAACLVSVYGNIVLRGEFTEDRQPLERFQYVPDLECPVQLHVGSLDVEIPAAHVDRFEAELSQAGKDFEIYRYEGADHIFADGSHANFNAEATAQMWPRIYSFLRRCTSAS
jgi:carboxymethylenebutenolidase